MTFTRKKILVFSDWFLPGFSAGGPIRSLANLVDTLDHDFYIVTRITDHHSTIPYAGIEAKKWIRHSEHVAVYYLNETEMSRKLLREILEERNYDLYYFNSLFSPRFTLLPLRFISSMGLKRRCILAPRGMLHAGALSVKPLKKQLFLRVSKLLGWFSGIRWHATNAKEADQIRNHYGKKADVRVAANLATVVKHEASPISKQPGEMHLVCIARISPEKGILEAVRFLKDAALSGKVTCTFYGIQQNTSYLHTCAALAREIPGAEIAFAGEIPPNQISAVLSRAHFFFLPTLGENFGHAIAEALQHGKPVIISDRTPWRNLSETYAGWDLPLQSYAFSEVLRLCLEMNQTTYNIWSNAALHYGRARAQHPNHVEDSYKIFD